MNQLKKPQIQAKIQVGVEEIEEMQIDDDGNWAAPSDNFWECYQEEYGQEDEFPCKTTQSPGMEMVGNRDPATEENLEKMDDLEESQDVERPPVDRRVKPSLPGTKTEWHKNGGKTLESARTSLNESERIPAKMANHRRENIYYPFQDKRDYEIGRFLSTLDIPMTRVDEFLKLDFVC